MSNRVTLELREHVNKEKKRFIIEELKKRNYRITSQRSLIIDTILENECSCCKEIYYEIVEKDATIGIATVYRMLALLEEMGVINRKNMYQIQSNGAESDSYRRCFEKDGVIFLEGDNQVDLPSLNWYNEIKEHLRKKGMIQNEEIAILIKTKKTC